MILFSNNHNVIHEIALIKEEQINALEEKMLFLEQIKDYPEIYRHLEKQIDKEIAHCIEMIRSWGIKICEIEKTCYYSIIRDYLYTLFDIRTDMWYPDIWYPTPKFANHKYGNKAIYTKNIVAYALEILRENRKKTDNCYNKKENIERAIRFFSSPGIEKRLENHAVKINRERAISYAKVFYGDDCKKYTDDELRIFLKKCDLVPAF